MHTETDGTWYALRTAPQRESLAALMIPKRTGYTVFMPVEYKWRRQARYTRKRARVAIPMFRGYIFARIDADVRWQELIEIEVPSKEIGPEIKTRADKDRLFTVDSVRILQGVVGFNGRPAPISDVAMEDLFRLHGKTVPHRKSVSTHRSINVGDLVLITGVGFDGHQFEVRSIGKGEAKVAMKWFGTVRETTVPMESLEAA